MNPLANQELLELLENELDTDLKTAIKSERERLVYCARYTNDTLPKVGRTKSFRC